MRVKATSGLKTLIAFAALALAMTGGAALAQDDGPGAVTLWWVVFNRPEHCATSPCELADLSRPQVRASVTYASGALTDEEGGVTFVTSLYETNPGAFQHLDPEETAPLAGPGLLDAERAEIHPIVRSHGPARFDISQDAVTAQLTRFLSPTCEALGGDNECRNIQAAIHPPEPGGSVSPVFDLGDGSVIGGASSTLIRRPGVVKLILTTSVSD